MPRQKAGFRKVMSNINSVADTVHHTALNLAAVPAYGAYWVPYQAAGVVTAVGDRLGAPGEVMSRFINISTFCLPQLIGLGTDATVDGLQMNAGFQDTIWDEGQERYYNPIHQFTPNGPKTEFPGMRADHTVDLRC